MSKPKFKEAGDKVIDVNRSKGKKRDGGTPEKSTTPNLSRDNGSEEAVIPIHSVIMNEEIEKLSIRKDDLQQLRSSQQSDCQATIQPAQKITVKKLKPAAELDQPKPKMVTVAKPAPHDAPLRQTNHSGFAGPRYDMEGQVVSHSLLGNFDDFRNMAVAKGDLLDFPEERSRLGSHQAKKGTPTVKYERKKHHPHISMNKHTDECHALKNWQNKMMERKQQQGYISDLLQKPVDQLVMNAADDFRSTEENRYLMDRVIPAVDYGKGYRVGSEFWKQQERIGNEMTGVHMTLTQSGKGFAPPIEHVGYASTVMSEKGHFVSSKTPVNYPWHMSPYLETRKQQLGHLIDELVPHKPNFDGLEVIGSSEPPLIPPEMPEFHVPRSFSGQGQIIEDHPVIPVDNIVPSQKSLVDSPKAPIYGPSIQFAGEPARWTGDSHSLSGQIGIEARVTFETYAGDRVTSVLEIVNDGTTVIYYNWKKLPKSNPFDLVHAKVQRFYFNTSSGVILPGETVKFPFVFKSPNAGVFTEQWKFETCPVVCGGAGLVVTLRGVALQEDKYKTQRKELEVDLSHREAQQVVTEIVYSLLRTIHTPDRCASPLDAYMTNEDRFRQLNPGLHYHDDVIADLNTLHTEVVSGEDAVQTDGDDWDLSVASLKQQMMALDEDEDRKDSLLNRLNLSVISLSLPKLGAKQKNMHRVGYQLLLDCVDKIVGHSMLIRTTLGLPDTNEPPDSDNSDKKGKMSASEKRDLSKDSNKKGAAPAKDAKAGKLAVKQDTKPEMKGKTPTPGSKLRSGTPAQGRSGSMATLAGKEDGPGVPDMLSPSPSIGDNVDPVLYRKYQEKLYVQAYQALQEMVDHMETAFTEIHEIEGRNSLASLMSL